MFSSSVCNDYGEGVIVSDTEGVGVVLKVCLFFSVCKCIFAGVRVLLCICCVFGCLSQCVYVFLWACVH